MNYDRQHFYRFKYLKSEHWQSLRLRKLAQQHGKCKICRFDAWNNDVHHINYRKLFDVRLSDLVVLCRDCHEKVHDVLESCSSIKDAKNSRSKWNRTVAKIRAKKRKEYQFNLSQLVKQACKRIRACVRFAKSNLIEEESPVFALSNRVVKKMARGVIPITPESVIEYSNPLLIGKTCFVWR